MPYLDVDGASYLALGPSDDDGVDDFWEDTRPLFASKWQRCGVAALCTVLTCYFLPMLSFIPLVLFGGVQLPSPWAEGYNNATATPFVVSHDMPTGNWYWDLPTVTALLLLLPFGLLGFAYVLKMNLPSSHVEEDQMLDVRHC
ncbi:unnamed protein product [Polarella glacialis]|uniref:Uncharacterized protein n=1 Tax=Polarella glacialis TaxID=89957 RepID=A0A813DZV9_POLGL|nr:unnamed protein product [Polarella glacialis]CAE8614904.1 unnamed protein product [Polarella glacialis]CAE8646352.1 unnamed protein product [Polarella glacialis]